MLLYVDKKGEVKERFSGIMHVGHTNYLTLLEAISQLLMKYSLTFSRVRGQGYDGASKMKGSINGLKILILNESSSAYYVHYFAHQLQLILVAVVKKNHDCSWLFETLTNLLNLVRKRQAEHVLKELGLSRPGDTRWHSHFITILNVLNFYPTILDVIDTIGVSSSEVDNVKAESLSSAMRRFDFIFIAQLMVNIFEVTNKLNLTLQRKEQQDILNVMRLVDVTNDSHMEKVSVFCSKYDIDNPSMDDLDVIPGRHIRGHRKYQLDTFKYDLQGDERFWNLKSLNELSMKLVETMEHLMHSKVYLLLKLVLVLPVATTTVERTFFAMIFIKNRLRNSMTDQWSNDFLVTLVEHDVFLNVTEEEIRINFVTPLKNN
ncbi:hypothetical protein RND81_11G076500 [Saponaria officinalis]|uniref:DUF4371 domain-containing protein n=1 Tax=Saponaria officinalis TaxID=3572 RepID=A0AAW1HJ42_SAPOF